VIGDLNGILSLLGGLVGGQLGIVNSTVGSADGEVNSTGRGRTSVRRSRRSRSDPEDWMHALDGVAP
jgi:hypothetical protein